MIKMLGNYLSEIDVEIDLLEDMCMFARNLWGGYDTSCYDDCILTLNRLLTLRGRNI